MPAPIDSNPNSISSNVNTGRHDRKRQKLAIKVAMALLNVRQKASEELLVIKARLDKIIASLDKGKGRRRDQSTAETEREQLMRDQNENNIRWLAANRRYKQCKTDWAAYGIDFAALEEKTRRAATAAVEGGPDLSSSSLSRRRTSDRPATPYHTPDQSLILDMSIPRRRRGRVAAENVGQGKEQDGDTLEGVFETAHSSFASGIEERPRELSPEQEAEEIERRGGKTGTVDQDQIGERPGAATMRYLIVALAGWKIGSTLLRE